jgi:TPR repeat protein
MPKRRPDVDEKRRETTRLLTLAERGEAVAKNALGAMLIHGEGVSSPRIKLGMELADQAAECGDPGARQFLSLCYARGAFGKPLNADPSREWEQSARDNRQFVEYGPVVDIEARGVILAKPTIEWT